MARNFTVTVKETGEGRPWLLVEADKDIGLSRDQNIVLDLPEGADIDEAHKVAKFLNHNHYGFASRGSDRVARACSTRASIQIAASLITSLKARTTKTKDVTIIHRSDAS